MSDIAFNNFERTKIVGLELTSSAVVGQQDKRANKWPTTTTGSLEALYNTNDPVKIPASKFTIHFKEQPRGSNIYWAVPRMPPQWFVASDPEGKPITNCVIGILDPGDGEYPVFLRSLRPRRTCSNR